MRTVTLATLLCTSVVCEAAPANGDDWLRASVPETAQVVAGTIEGGVRCRILILGNGLISRTLHIHPTASRPVSTPQAQACNARPLTLPSAPSSRCWHQHRHGRTECV